VSICLGYHIEAMSNYLMPKWFIKFSQLVLNYTNMSCGLQSTEKAFYQMLVLFSISLSQSLPEYVYLRNKRTSISYLYFSWLLPVKWSCLDFSHCRPCQFTHARFFDFQNSWTGHCKHQIGSTNVEFKQQVLGAQTQIKTWKIACFAYTYTHIYTGAD